MSELNNMAEGFRWREKRWMWMIAWAVAHLMNAAGVHPKVTVNKLLGIKETIDYERHAQQISESRARAAKARAEREAVDKAAKVKQNGA